MVTARGDERVAVGTVSDAPGILMFKGWPDLAAGFQVPAIDHAAADCRGVPIIGTDGQSRRVRAGGMEDERASGLSPRDVPATNCAVATEGDERLAVTR